MAKTRADMSNQAGIGVDGFGPQAFEPEVFEMALVVPVEARAVCVDGDSDAGFSSRVNAALRFADRRNGREEHAAKFNPHDIAPGSGFVHHNLAASDPSQLPRKFIAEYGTTQCSTSELRNAALRNAALRWRPSMMLQMRANKALDEPIAVVISGMPTQQQRLPGLCARLLQSIRTQLGFEKRIGQSLINQQRSRQTVTGCQQRTGIVCGPGRGLCAKIARERFLSPRHAGGCRNWRKG